MCITEILFRKYPINYFDDTHKKTTVFLICLWEAEPPYSNAKT